MGRINADDVATSKCFGCSASNIQGVRVGNPLLLYAIRNLGPTRVYWNSKYFEFRLIDGDTNDAATITQLWHRIDNARKQSDGGSDEPCPTERNASASA